MDGGAPALPDVRPRAEAAGASSSTPSARMDGGAPAPPDVPPRADEAEASSSTRSGRMDGGAPTPPDVPPRADEAGASSSTLSGRMDGGAPAPPDLPSRRLRPGPSARRLHQRLAPGARAGRGEPQPRGRGRSGRDLHPRQRARPPRLQRLRRRAARRLPLRRPPRQHDPAPGAPRGRRLAERGGPRGRRPGHLRPPRRRSLGTGGDAAGGLPPAVGRGAERARRRLPNLRDRPAAGFRALPGHGRGRRCRRPGRPLLQRLAVAERRVGLGAPVDRRVLRRRPLDRPGRGPRAERGRRPRRPRRARARGPLQSLRRAASRGGRAALDERGADPPRRDLLGSGPAQRHRRLGIRDSGRGGAAGRARGTAVTRIRAVRRRGVHRAGLRGGLRARAGRARLPLPQRPRRQDPPARRGPRPRGRRAAPHGRGCRSDARRLRHRAAEAGGGRLLLARHARESRRPGQRGDRRRARPHHALGSSADRLRPLRRRELRDAARRARHRAGHQGRLLLLPRDQGRRGRPAGDDRGAGRGSAARGHRARRCRAPRLPHRGADEDHRRVLDRGAPGDPRRLRQPLPGRRRGVRRPRSLARRRPRALRRTGVRRLRQRSFRRARRGPRQLLVQGQGRGLVHRDRLEPGPAVGAADRDHPAAAARPARVRHRPAGPDRRPLLGRSHRRGAGSQRGPSRRRGGHPGRARVGGPRHHLLPRRGLRDCGGLGAACRRIQPRDLLPAGHCRRRPDHHHVGKRLDRRLADRNHHRRRAGGARLPHPVARDARR